MAQNFVVSAIKLDFEKAFVLLVHREFKIATELGVQFIEKGFTHDSRPYFLPIACPSGILSEFSALYRTNDAYVPQLLTFENPTLKQLIMKTTTDPKEGLWMMVEEPIEQTLENTPPAPSDSFRDTYDYFPDFGI